MSVPMTSTYTVNREKERKKSEETEKTEKKQEETERKEREVLMIYTELHSPFHSVFPYLFSFSPFDHPPPPFHLQTAVDRATGAFKWKFKTCNNVFSSAALADDGTVFIACNTETGPSWQEKGIGAVYRINPSRHV